jgi:uncharacterized protein (UPF0332 family)
MTPEEQALVCYRMERATEALDEAQLLLQAGHLHTFVNRLYYACFYAISALLLTKGLSTSKHTHLRGLLHRELVHPGIISIEHGRFFDLLFNNRQKGDYADLVVFQAEQIEGWLGQAREFVAYISTKIPTPR